MRTVYTNRFNLPRPFAAAVEILERRYSPGQCDFSATALTEPPRIYGLKKMVEREGRTIVVDVAECSHSIIGTGVHNVLECLRDHPEYEVEQRFFRNIWDEKTGREWRISAKIDGYDRVEKALFDWKGTRHRTYADGVKLEYVSQLNVGRWCIEGGTDEYGISHNWPIEKMYSAPLYRDYSAMTAPHKEPHLPVGGFPVPMWTESDTERWILGKIRRLVAAEQSLPLCSADDKWEKPTLWAVEPKKKGRARRLLPSLEAAEVFLANHKDARNLRIVKRPGACPRCRHYCPVSSICEQWAHDPMNPVNNQEEKAREREKQTELWNQPEE